MRVLVTGSDGFIGRNLVAWLGERGDFEVLPYTRASTEADLDARIAQTDFVFHLAGVNRPTDPADFDTGNAGFTRTLVERIAHQKRILPVVFASSVQAERDNLYGVSKRAAEEALLAYGKASGFPVYIYRLANVFGKWCRPNYNSVVATFCHNVARGLPISIHDPAAAVSLVYIDDVADEFIRVLGRHHSGCGPAPSGPYRDAGPVYDTTVGELAAMIRGFRDSRVTLTPGRVGAGLARALYATYVSYLPPESFSYAISKHVDPRGEFAEVLKTPDCGQFSYFTAHPGVTRGNHYHHSKTEKFLVIRGRARFRFRHLASATPLSSKPRATPRGSSRASPGGRTTLPTSAARR